MTEPYQPPPSRPEPGPARRADLPPDPEQYDSERAQHARARGLDAPYIPGGVDPELEATKAREQRYLRLLIAMVAILVLSGFVVGAIGSFFQGL